MTQAFRITSSAIYFPDMPPICVSSGVKPGVISAGFGRRHGPVSFPMNSSTRHTCPVINCGRVYENASLLEGHLKR